MPTFKSKKVETVDARQFTGGEENATELAFYIDSHGGNARWEDKTDDRPENIRVTTDTYAERIYVGDWVIIKQDGTLYHSRPQDFEAEYEQV